VRTFTMINIDSLCGTGKHPVVKRLTITSSSDLRDGFQTEATTQSFVFQPPYTDRYLSSRARAKNSTRTARHGFSWNDGRIPYTELSDILRDACSSQGRGDHIIYARGSTYCWFISEITGVQVLNFERDYNPRWGNVV
jgi:hypothetical protein